MLLRQLNQLLTGQGHRSLVAGDHMTAFLQGRTDMIDGRLSGLDIGIGDLHDDVGAAFTNSLQTVPTWGRPWMAVDSSVFLDLLEHLLQIQTVGLEDRAPVDVRNGHHRGLISESIV